MINELLTDIQYKLLSFFYVHVFSKTRFSYRFFLYCNKKFPSADGIIEDSFFYE